MLTLQSVYASDKIEKIKMKRSPTVLCTLTLLSLFLFACSSKTHDIVISKHVVSLPRTDWKEMDNPTSFAKNFEARRMRNSEVFSQVITIFLEPMPKEKKIGMQLSDLEYVELFTVHPNTITAQIRVDKGYYWMLSRQTFRDYRPVGKKPLNNFGTLDQIEVSEFLTMYEEDVKETRYKLRNL